MEEADIYLAPEMGFHEIWGPLSDDAKESALITAYREMQTLSLKPCTPIEILAQAQIMEAFALVNPTIAEAAENAARGLKSVSLGSASESYGTSYSPNSPRSLGMGLYSERAYRLLRPYLIQAVRIV